MHEYYGDIHDESVNELLHYCEFPPNSSDEVRLCLTVAKTLIGAGYLHDGCWANACTALCGATEKKWRREEHLKRQTLEDDFISLAREVERRRENPRSDAAVIDHAKRAIQVAIDRKQIHCERKIFWQSADRGDESAEAVWTFPAKLDELLQSDPCTLIAREWFTNDQEELTIGEAPAEDTIPVMIEPAEISFGAGDETATSRVAPIPWKMLRALFLSPSHKLKIDDLEELVWGEESKFGSKSRLKSAVTKANAALSQVGYVHSVSTKDGWVLIS